MNQDHPTAIEISAAVRDGSRSALEVVEEHLARIAQAEADIHAFNYVMADEAKAAARAIDAKVAAGEDPGPLAGVPVALKDNMCTRGVATTCSSKILEGWKPPYDATVVERLVGAGAIIIGKTNLIHGALAADAAADALAKVTTELGPLHCTFPATVPATGKIAVVVRPESVVIAKQGSAEAGGFSAVNRIEGVVRSEIYLGEIIEYNVVTDNGTELVIRVPPGKDVGKDDKVLMHFPPENTVALIEK